MLAGIKIKLIIKGTKVLPMFQGGQYEGNLSAFVAVEGPDKVTVRLLSRVITTIAIPCKFLEPFPPSGIVGEKVVAICGENVGSEYLVCGIANDKFSLTHCLSPTLEILILPKHFLAAISRL
jgi:hypothetical protein